MTGYYDSLSWCCEKCHTEHPPAVPFRIRYFWDDQEQILCSDCYEHYQNTDI